LIYFQTKKFGKVFLKSQKEKNNYNYRSWRLKRGSIGAIPKAVFFSPRNMLLTKSPAIFSDELEKVHFPPIVLAVHFPSSLVWFEVCKTPCPLIFYKINEKLIEKKKTNQ
jgi:hypothetical protein